MATATPPQPINYCLVLYPACVTNAQPIYVFIGQGSFDPLFLILNYEEQYFVQVDEAGFDGWYYTAGICPTVPATEPCTQCLYSPEKPLPYSSLTGFILTNGQTCYGNNCIILQNCENNSEQLIAPPSFEAYLGSTVKLEGSDKCWQVLYNNGSCYGIEYITATSVCSDCIDCLPQVEPEIPRVIPQYFEDFTQTIEDQCEVDTNVKFANAYWELFKSLKHGMESSCQTIDIDRITIKKKEIDIAKLYDATACVVPEPSPEPEICIEPTGTPLPAPTPQTVWTYHTIATLACCYTSFICQDACQTFLLDSAKGLNFNFTLDFPLDLNNLPALVTYHDCCLRITAVDEILDENASTFDFAGQSWVWNEIDCAACQS